MSLLKRLFLCAVLPFVCVWGACASNMDELEPSLSAPLPPEIQAEMFSFLTLSELRFVAPVCKEWKAYQGACYEKWIKDEAWRTSINLPRGAYKMAVRNILAQDGVALLRDAIDLEGASFFHVRGQSYDACEAGVFYSALFGVEKKDLDVTDLLSVMFALPHGTVYYKPDAFGGRAHVLAYLRQFIEAYAKCNGPFVRFKETSHVPPLSRNHTVVLTSDELVFKDRLNQLIEENPYRRLHVVFKKSQDLMRVTQFNASVLPYRTYHLTLSDPMDGDFEIGAYFLAMMPFLSYLEFQGSWNARGVGRCFLFQSNALKDVVIEFGSCELKKAVEGAMKERMDLVAQKQG